MSKRKLLLFKDLISKLQRRYDYVSAIEILESNAGQKLFTRYNRFDFGDYSALQESSSNYRGSDNDNRGIGNRAGSAGTDTSEIRETERNTQLQARNLNSDLDTSEKTYSLGDAPQ